MAKKSSSKVGKEFERVALLMRSGKIMPGQADQQSIKLMAQELMQGVFSGYGATFANLDPESVDYQTLSYLENNVHVFSGFKNYRELQEVGALLVKSGKVTSKHDFLQAAKAIDKTYNQIYKEAERNLALTSAQEARWWHQVQADKELFPYVEYVAVIDGHETPYCHYLDGKIFSVNDPILHTIWPPNHWRCRSHFKQLAEGAPSLIEPELMPKIAPMFQNNVGINGTVFPDTHPYFDVSKGASASIIDAIMVIVPNKNANYLRWLDLKTDNQFKNVSNFNQSTGGYRATHIAHGKNEIIKNEYIAEQLTEDGFGVELNEKFDNKKSADATIHLKGQWEFKKLIGTKASTIDQALREAKKQANNVVLFLTNPIAADDLINGLNDRVNRTNKIQHVLIKSKGKPAIILSRKDIISGRAGDRIKDIYK